MLPFFVDCNRPEQSLRLTAECSHGFVNPMPKGWVLPSSDSSDAEGLVVCVLHGCYLSEQTEIEFMSYVDDCGTYE